MPDGLDPEIYEDQYKFFGDQGKLRVVNIKDDPSIIHHPDFVYIGRYNGYYNLAQSKWANFYQIGRDGTREEVIIKYEVYMPPELKACLYELEGKILGCWCVPLACHGNVLVRLVEGLRWGYHHEYKRKCEHLDRSFGADWVTCLHAGNSIGICSSEYCPKKKMST